MNFGQVESIRVPYTFNDGDAELVLKVYASYYDTQELVFPINIDIWKFFMKSHVILACEINTGEPYVQRLYSS